jgi:hypothetical protein
VARIRRILLAGLIACCAGIGSLPALGAPRAARSATAHRIGARGHRLHFWAAATDHACPDGGLMPSTFDIEGVRAATLCLVNRERAAHREPPLRVNAELQRAAQAHTESMAFGDYVEHMGPSGDTPLSRARRAGYMSGPHSGFEMGENIAWGTGSRATPDEIVASWMASSGHRANILNPHFRDTAIGVSSHPPVSYSGGRSGGIYTEDFAVILPG